MELKISEHLDKNEIASILGGVLLAIGFKKVITTFDTFLFELSPLPEMLTTVLIFGVAWYLIFKIK